MNVKLIRGTDDPEELLCRAARNDYRRDGVIGYSFEEVMEAVDPDEAHIEDVRGERWGLAQDRPREDAARLEAKKRTLIDDLISSGHYGPFEHPQATVAIEGVTRVVTHQIVRHRHFTYDQQSLRYTGLEEADGIEWAQMPEFRGDDFDVDRDGVHELDDTDAVEAAYEGAYRDAHRHYRHLLELGVPQEQARKALPMGTKSNIVMSGNLRAWMHILGVRKKADVQGETRRCAEAIFEELKEWAPYTMAKYNEDVLPLKLNP